YILVSDQVKDVVQRYDLDGNYVDVFAPVGGPNTSILDNIRGIAYHTNGNLLVSNAGGANADCVAAFDTGGNYIGNFVANGEVDPFDVMYWETLNSYLVCDIADPDYLKNYDDTGTLINIITDNVNFPEQVALAANGNILVACFSAPSGVHEYQPDGTLVGIYNPLDAACRGVYELPNGNILVTDGDGVHEIDRSGNLIEDKITGVSGRFINLVIQEQAPSGYFEDFEDGVLPPGWDVIDNDGNGTTWDVYNTLNSHSGEWCVRTQYNLDECDDWLLAPFAMIGENYVFSLWAAANTTSYRENFFIWAAVNGGSYDFLIAEVIITPGDWTYYSCMITDHPDINAGDLVSLAVQCVSLGESFLYLDDIYLGEMIVDPNPVCATDPVPADDAIDVPVDSFVGWTYTHDPAYTEPIGFRIYMAYDEDLTDAFIGYVPYTGEGNYLIPHPIEFAYATQYFWKVVPTTEESRGDAVDCPVWSFTTVNYPDPVCATDPVPVDDAIDVPVDSDVGWTYTHDPAYTEPNGFRIYMAYDEDLTDAFIGYVPYTGEGNYLIPHPIDFDYSTEYFWKVVPTTEDSRGDAADCPVWSFTTESGINNDPADLLPNITALMGNYPNPFNPVTTIHFTVTENDQAVLTIMNIKGQVLERMDFGPGDHYYEWEARGLESGIYFYKLSATKYNNVKKMLLLR
ncbi:MAG: choice-of-anchor J domain-containing protein, partial [Candidatus Cloacimonetes bacterium]|nr:choice-of-anchor J domain-containing protein [Candidatus Cloacimonadota bacterium]